MKKSCQYLLIASILAGTPFATLMANEVVVYTSVDDVFARPITEKFEQQSGIKVKFRPQQCLRKNAPPSQ